MERPPIAFELVTAPASEPVSLDEAKSQCRLDGTNDFDSDLTWLIQVAREKVEADSERAFITQTRRIWIDQFPIAGYGRSGLNPFPAQPWLYGGAMQALEIPIKPISAISTIKYYAPAGTLTTMDPSTYIVDIVSSPCRITPAFGLIWPVCQVRINAVQIDFVCGHTAAANVPAMARHAMRLLIGHWFENREAVGKVPTSIPMGYESLINSIRWH